MFFFSTHLSDCKEYISEIYWRICVNILPEDQLGLPWEDIHFLVPGPDSGILYFEMSFINLQGHQERQQVALLLFQFLHSHGGDFYLLLDFLFEHCVPRWWVWTHSVHWVIQPKILILITIHLVLSCKRPTFIRLRGTTESDILCQ